MYKAHRCLVGVGVACIPVGMFLMRMDDFAEHSGLLRTVGCATGLFGGALALLSALAAYRLSRRSQ